MSGIPHQGPWLSSRNEGCYILLYISAILKHSTLYDLRPSQTAPKGVWHNLLYTVCVCVCVCVCTWEMGWLTYTQPVRGLTLRYSGCSLDIEYVTAALVPKSSSWAATRKKLVPIIVSSRRKSVAEEEEEVRFLPQWFCEAFICNLFQYSVRVSSVHCNSRKCTQINTNKMQVNWETHPQIWQYIHMRR